MQDKDELIQDVNKFIEIPDGMIETVSFHMYDFKVIVNGEDLNLDVSLYIEIIKNYAEYLKAIDYFGGFMLYNHLYKFFGEYYENKKNGIRKGKTKIFEDIKKMEKLELLRNEKIGQYYYVLLSKKALIYLKGRNNVPYIARPSTVALMTNAYIFDLALNNYMYIYDVFYDNFENYLGSIAGKLYSALLNDPIAKNRIEYSYQVVNKTQGIVVKLERPFLFKDYLTDQIELSRLPHIKTKKIIEAKKKGKEEKSKIEHVRVTKVYDDITRLITKHVYFNKFEKLENGSFLLYFVVLDIDSSMIWIRNILKEIDLVLNKLNAELENPKIFANIMIYTKDIENEERLRKQLLKAAKDFDKDTKAARNRVAVNIKMYYLVPRYDRKALFYIRKIRIYENNTNRFFSTKGDVINTISDDQISIINLK